MSFPFVILVYWRVCLGVVYKQKGPCTTVDGRNPAPPGIYQNLVNNGINYIPTSTGEFTGFLVAINSTIGKG